MRIRVDDIPESGMEVSADTVKNAWYKNVLIEVLGPDRFKAGDGGRLVFQVARNGDNISIVGGSILKFHPTCDRCLVTFEKQQQVPINLMLLQANGRKPAKNVSEHPALPVRAKGAWGETASHRDGRSPHFDDDDEDLGFYKGEEIDLGDIVREHILLAQEIVNLCRDDCKGLCQSCGKNLNKAECGCGKKEEESSPFAILKKLQKP